MSANETRSATITATARVEVRPHALDVDLEPADRIGRRGDGAAGERERARERLPLRVPRSDRALVLVGSRLRAGRSHARVARRAQASAIVDETGLRFCGIVDEPPPAELDHLADLGLGEERDVEADLRGRCRRRVERGAELRDTLTVRSATGERARRARAPRA